MPICWRFTKTPQKDIWTVTVCLSIRMANVTGSIWPASSTFGLLPYLCPASTMLQPYCYHASTGVYLLGNQWCSPWSLVSDLTSSGFFSSPIGVPVPLFFQCRRGQGGRTWQPFVGSKNGNKNFRQVHIYNFRDKHTYPETEKRYKV